MGRFGVYGKPWKCKVDWARYRATVRRGLEHFFTSAQDVRDYLAGAGRGHARRALFHVLYCGLVLAGAYKLVDRRAKQLLRMYAMKEEQQNNAVTIRVDEKAAYALWAVLGGDVQTVAAMLEVPEKVITNLVVTKGWRLPPKRRVSREVALNRGLDFLIAHKLRATVHKLVEGLNALRTDELYRLLLMRSGTKQAKLQIKDFEALARTLATLHHVTQSTLMEMDSDDGAATAVNAFLATPSAAPAQVTCADSAQAIENPVENAVETESSTLPQPVLTNSSLGLSGVIEKTVSDFFREALQDPQHVAESLRQAIFQAENAPGTENQAQNGETQKRSRVEFRSDDVFNRPLTTTVAHYGSEPPPSPARTASEVDPAIGAIPVSVENLEEAIEQQAEEDD